MSSSASYSVSMATRESNLELVTRFWNELYARNYDALAATFTAEALYQDVPVPDGDVTGPQAIVRKLRVGFDKVGRHDHVIHRMIADESTVMTEHTETWHFDDAHSVSLPFVTVHEIEDGKIRLWRDYWNFSTLMDGAPQWWIEHIMKAWEEA